MIVLAEALSFEQTPNTQGNLLYTVRVLDEGSHKYREMKKVLSNKIVSRWIKLHEHFERFLNTEKPLIIVTDWTDPCELVGLRLETPDGILEYPDLCFLGLFTDWECLPDSGIEEIFAHELSHLWLHWLGYKPHYSQSNRFHTCTAITDPYLAFSEGFAEHLEIISCPNAEDELYDHGFDLSAWLCNRDKALRHHAVKNNRFLYLTAEPEISDEFDYARIHMLHNTSSAFLPERLKNGRQAAASEGLIASFFYRLVTNEKIKASFAEGALYAQFGADINSVSKEDNVYFKILYALSKMNFDSDVLFTEFISKYMSLFPAEKEEVIDVFGTVTNYVTVNKDAQKLFADFYVCGRLGVPDTLIKQFQEVKEFKQKCKNDILSGTVRLDDAVAPGIYITSDREITPVPWEPAYREKLKIDINTATAIDFLALNGLTLDLAHKLVDIRERQGGFHSYSDYEKTLKGLI